ncbi:MAG: Nif3-like dinuclear metal center hexameric protein [Phycisphaeraceae bacterium]|nr:MAG: Nif3-like dinuclear metal center hexameric protein [Phycisphaeraceae bacterium]
MPNTVAGLVDAIERIAPLAGAEPWDRVGLHVGDPSRDLAGPVLLTIDLTERVLDEAVGIRASAIIAYHPPIWEPLTRLASATTAERIIRGAIEAGIAIYSPHTAIDSARGGVTDWLCEGIAGTTGPEDDPRIACDVRALASQATLDRKQEVKLVVFTPPEAVEHLRGALATAGAGQIGEYAVCSFASEGEGTFLGSEASHPLVGEAGRLERVREVRLEMVCSRFALPLAIETLRQFHPYEEPAFDIYELQPKPNRATGMGRRLVLDQPLTVPEIGAKLRAHLGVSRLKYALPEGMDEDTRLHKIGVVPGSGGSGIEIAVGSGCQLFITGEMTHHNVLAATALGMAVLLAGHTNTERGYLPRLATKLGAMLDGVEFRISRTDRDPLVVMR